MSRYVRMSPARKAPTASVIGSSSCTEWRSGVTMPGGYTNPRSKYERMNVLSGRAGSVETFEKNDSQASP